MSCYHPLDVVLAVNKEDGKRKVLFGAPPLSASKLDFIKRKLGSDWTFKEDMKIPCGQCIGCRLEYSRNWALRCIHESKDYDQNCFITLTYNNENLPVDGSLHKDHFQKFMKRLRKYISQFDKKVRFFSCGEYGALHSRPHYHAILFGYDFEDKKLLFDSHGFPVYTSEILHNLWPFGFSTVAGVSYESCAYVARYVVKKFKGTAEQKEEYYRGKVPEFTLMSRRPGIGRDWIEKFIDDVYPSDFVVYKGRKVKPPRYYDNFLKTLSEIEYNALKLKRALVAKEKQETQERLDVKEKCKLLSISDLVRPYEEGMNDLNETLRIV